MEKRAGGGSSHALKLRSKNSIKGRMLGRRERIEGAIGKWRRARWVIVGGRLGVNSGGDEGDGERMAREMRGVGSPKDLDELASSQDAGKELAAAVSGVALVPLTEDND
jgi:hypothetical protein